MALGRDAVFTIADLVVEALRNAHPTASGLAGEAVIVDGPISPYPNTTIAIGTVREGDREPVGLGNDYKATLEIDIGFWHVDDNIQPNHQNLAPWGALRRRFSDLVGWAATTLETDDALDAVSDRVELLTDAFTPVERSSGGQIVAAGTLEVDVLIRP